jgi:formylglycine-generating enzyme required for sulfatase activity
MGTAYTKDFSITINVYSFTTPAQYRELVLATPNAIDTVPIIGNAAYNASDHVTLFPAGRSVTLSPFKIAKYETTYELWYDVKQWAGSHGYTFANSGREGHNGTTGVAPTAAKMEPVTGINWRDAIVWCNAYSEMTGKEPVYYTDSTYTTVLRISTNDSGYNTMADDAVMKADADGYRLPTEAEWEYAARGGGTPSTTGAFANRWAGTDTESDLVNYAWYSANSGNATHVAGEKTANGLGLYDMNGNVVEWCWDWYYPISTPETVPNPTGPVAGTFRVIRGGCWINAAIYCAVAYRRSATPDVKDNDLGFRVVCLP